MRSDNRNGTKMLAAAVGGSALVAMGAFTVMAGGQPASSSSLVSGGMTTGVTITETTPAASLVTSVAVPAVKAVAYK